MLELVPKDNFGWCEAAAGPQMPSFPPCFLLGGSLAPPAWYFRGTACRTACLINARMLFVPIVERELRLASRNWRTYYARLFAGAAALAITLYLIWMVEGILGGARIGGHVLAGLSILALGICLYTGVSRTSDCISSEKRNDTLGLLFLTHLKAYDIIVGKLAANSMRGLLLLLATVPVLSVPIFLGGVTGSELVRIPVTLLNALLLAVSIAIFASTLTRSQHAAHGLAAGMITLLAIVLPAVSIVVQRFSNVPHLAVYFGLPSPSYALQMSFESTFGLRTNLFWLAIALQFGIALCALVAACLMLPHSWQVKAGTQSKIRLKTANSFANSKRGLARRRRMLDRNPFLWLACRDRFAPLWPVFFAIVTLVVAAWCIVYFKVEVEQGYAILFVTLALNDFTMRMRVGSLSALTLGTARQNGALEMILSTPLSVREIIRGQWMAIRHKLLWTYLPLLLAFLITSAKYSQLSFGNAYIMGFFIALSIGDFITMGYVAMWKAMRVRNVQHAPGAALLRVVVLPWFLWMGVIPLLISANSLRWLAEELGPFAFFVSALAIWAWNSIAAFRSARRNLFEHFREAATDRYNFEQRTDPFANLRRWASDNFPTIYLLRGRQPRVLN